MHRLFVAIRPPVAVRARLLAAMGGILGARWQKDAQLHLTLRFIGEVDWRQADDIATALRLIRNPPIEIAVEGIGSFDRKGRVDTLWAGVTPAEPLAALHHKIDHALVRCGLAPETRAYRPHITLARFALGANADLSSFAEMHAGLHAGAFTANHFALYESHVGQGGAHYEEVVRYPLA